MTEQRWIEKSVPFLEAIDTWYHSLPALKMKDTFRSPARAAVWCTDMTNAFAYEGRLASPRVAAIIPPIVNLFQKAYDLGVRYFLLPQDQHTTDALEFQSYGPHAVVGTHEAETVPELTGLPFSNLFLLFPKNSLHPTFGNNLDEWIDVHPGVTTYIVVGNCTDLCVYQATMHLRLKANAKNQARRVILPANCVNTYDLPVEAARSLGVLPHDADLLHYLFLYHMALNGVEVVRELS